MKEHEHATKNEAEPRPTQDEVAKKAYCVIQTGERRFYGCFIFKKGVVPPE